MEYSMDYQKPFVITNRVKVLWNKLNIAMMQNSQAKTTIK